MAELIKHLLIVSTYIIIIYYLQSTIIYRKMRMESNNRSKVFT